MLKNFVIALQFLTRIKINPSLEFAEEEFAASLKSYPLVGLSLGLISLALFFVLNNILKFPIFASAAFILVAEIYLTGGLHLDGLIDSADGFLNNFHKDKEQIVKIMKDSRIGANGATALFSILLLKLSLLLVVLPKYLGVLILMPLLSRWILLYLSVTYPYGGTEGSLGGMVIGKKMTEELKIGTIFAGISSLVIMIFSIKGGACSFGNSFLIIFAAWLVSIFGIKYLAEKVVQKLGGLTGDILGASLELVEVIVLFTTAMILGIMG